MVENHNITHTRMASWLFPLYLFLISLFVFPIAIAGKMLLSANIEPDTYVLSLPLWADAPGWHCWFILESFGAAASMVVVSVIALSIMVSNNLLMPLLVRSRTVGADGYALLSDRLLGLRRIPWLWFILFLAYAFYKLVTKDFRWCLLVWFHFAAILQPFSFGRNVPGLQKGAVAPF